MNAAAKRYYDEGYRKGARDARQGIWNPGLRYKTSKYYRDGYAQAREDHHKIGPAPLARAPHLRPVLPTKSEAPTDG